METMQPGDVFSLFVDRTGKWWCMIIRNGSSVSNNMMFNGFLRYGFGNPQQKPVDLEKAVSALLVATEAAHLAPVFTEVSIPASQRREPVRFEKSALTEAALSLFNDIARQNTLLPRRELGEMMTELDGLSPQVRGVLVRAADAKGC